MEYGVWIEFVIIHRKLSKRKTIIINFKKKKTKRETFNILYSSNVNYI